MKTLTALGGGLAGAATVTLIHESIKKLVPQAPRMDLLGMNAIARGLDATGLERPSPAKLFAWALAADIVSNSLYYSMAGIGKEKNIWVKSALLGLAAGVGAVLLPRPLGLEERHSNRSVGTKLMTIGLYVAGSLVTAAVIKMAAGKKEKRKKEWERKLVTSAMG